MCYTYYWRWITAPDHDRFACWSQDVKTLIDSLFLYPEFTNGSIKICGPDGADNPILTERWVAFNGDAETGQANDTFIVDLDNLKPLSVMLAGNSPNDEEILSIDNWCDTGGETYDLVVKVSLIRLVHYFPKEFRIKSNSGNYDEWVPSNLLCQKIFGVEDVYFAWSPLGECFVINDGLDESEAESYDF